MMSCTVNIPKRLEKRLLYNYVVRKQKAGETLFEMIGARNDMCRLLSIPNLDEIQRE